MNEEEEGTFVGMHLHRTRKEKEGVGTYMLSRKWERGRAEIAKHGGGRRNWAEKKGGGGS